MIGMLAKDSAFFTIKTLNLPGIDQNVLQTDLISLTVTEEMDRVTSGSISLRDPSDLYSKLLRFGVQIEVSWGYKKNFSSIGLLGIGGGDLFAKGMDRRGMKAFIQNPSGGGSSNGEKTYNANFIGADWLGFDDPKTWEGMTRGVMIRAVLAKMGVYASDVRFKDADLVIPIGNGVRQVESDFRFLVRLGKEWRALFRAGYSPKGALMAVFLDNDSLIDSVVAKEMAGAGVTLNYNAGPDSNVLEYSWQNSEGENGAGDNVRLVFVNGELVPQRFTVENEKVMVWQLNTKRVHEEALKHDVASYAILVADAVSITDFERVKHYFDPIEQETAPNGLGYTVNAKIIGNPFASPPALIKFGTGFPAPITTELTRVGMPNRYYLRKATHSITRSGYFTDLEVADVYIINPAGGGSLF